jgi:hypothetical protein
MQPLLRDTFSLPYISKIEGTTEYSKTSIPLLDDITNSFGTKNYALRKSTAGNRLRNPKTGL